MWRALTAALVAAAVHARIGGAAGLKFLRPPAPPIAPASSVSAADRAELHPTTTLALACVALQPHCLAKHVRITSGDHADPARARDRVVKRSGFDAAKIVWCVQQGLAFRLYSHD